MTDEYLAARLLSAGCRVDAAGYEDNTALHRAAERGSVELVRLLIDVAEANMALTNAAGNTPLMVACENGNVDVVQCLLQRSPATGDCPHSASLHCSNTDGKTCFHMAALSGEVELVDLLLQAGVPAYDVDSAGNTALVLSIWSRNFDFASRLLQTVNSSGLSTAQRADYVNRQGELGRNATHWAALHGSVSLLDALSVAADGRLDAEARDVAGDTPLLLAAKADRVGVLRWLVGRNCDVNARGELGRTALHWTVMAADRDAVERLLAVDGVAAAVLDEADCTPLLLAAANHRYAEMRTILRSAAGDVDVDRRDGEGRTALHWICKVNYVTYWAMVNNAGKTMSFAGMEIVVIEVTAKLRDVFDIHGVTVASRSRSDNWRHVPYY